VRYPSTFSPEAMIADYQERFSSWLAVEKGY
jgi:hypothetical protein